MKIPKGWWKVEAGRYAEKVNEPTLVNPSSIELVEWYDRLADFPSGWYAFRGRVGVSDLIGVYPTAREAFKALGVKP